MDATRTSAEATLIIGGILILLGLAEDRYAVATRRTGAVNVVAMDDETDRFFVRNADQIEEVSAKAGSRFTVKWLRGTPVLTNEGTLAA